MNIYNHIQSKVFANDPDYDALHGRLVAQYTVERVDRRRNCTIRTTYEVIDIGRPDRVRPVDPDAQMGSERLSYDDTQTVENRARRRASERFAEMHMAVVAYLRQYEPTHMRAMADDLEYAKTTLDEFVRQREGRVFCKVGNVGRAVLWGLVGIHDKGSEL